MPSLCFHLGIAWEALPSLHPVVGEQRGVYLFGATLPDVHLLSKLRREETHFVDVFHGERGGKEVESFFKAFPHLCGPEVDRSLRALAAGYLSHIVCDSLWLEQIYHPYFGLASPLAGNPLANLLDRALQYDLDHRERQDKAKTEALVQDIAQMRWDAGAGLFDGLDLAAWQTFVLASLRREPSWEHFPFYARTFLVPQGKIAPDKLEEFLSLLPERVKWVLSYVTPERIASFRRESVAATIKVAQQHLL